MTGGATTCGAAIAGAAMVGVCAIGAGVGCLAGCGADGTLRSGPPDNRGELSEGTTATYCGAASGVG